MGCVEDNSYDVCIIRNGRRIKNGDVIISSNPKRVKNTMQKAIDNTAGEWRMVAIPRNAKSKTITVDRSVKNG